MLVVKYPSYNKDDLMADAKYPKMTANFQHKNKGHELHIKHKVKFVAS